MAGRLILGTANPSVDGNGNPVAGSTLTFYQNGTTTLQSVYTAVGLGTPLANPLTCDAAGEFPQVWAPSFVGYSVKWARPGMADVTYNDIYASGGPAAVSTTTVLTTGTAATYTTPTGVRQLKIRMMGGGAGGSGTNNTAGVGGLVAGTAGQKTIFNGIEANGGKAGSGFSGGGASGNGAGTANLRVQGPPGAPGAADNAAGRVAGTGGGGPFGGAGPGAGADGGGGPDATGFTGAGGGGAANAATGKSGPGGGAGEYVELIINAPAASYTYTVAQSVLGGFTTQPGGAGSGGLVVIEEVY